MTETVREILERLEKELSTKVAALRRELTPLDKELADIRRAKEALDAPRRAQTAELFKSAAAVMAVISSPPFGKPPDLSKLTMKQLATKALSEHFRNGATANELLELFHKVWGRNDVLRESLSPQLSRLNKEGKLNYDGKRWHLALPSPPPPEDPRYNVDLTAEFEKDQATED